MGINEKQLPTITCNWGEPKQSSLTVIAHTRKSLYLCRLCMCVVCVRYKQEKRRQYEQRVCEIEHAIFTTLVMSATGGMGRAATTFYKRLASMISEKRNTEYSNSQTVNWIRCKLSFALLRALIMSTQESKVIKTSCSI